VAQLEVEKGVSSLHVSEGLHFDRVLGSFVDEQEVEGVVSRGVHHILLQPQVDSSNCEELVPACIRLGDGDPLSLGDVSAFLSPSIHLAGKLTCLCSHVDAVASVDKFGAVSTFGSCTPDLKFCDGKVKVKCCVKEVGLVHSLQVEDPVRVKSRLDRRAGKHPGREG